MAQFESFQKHLKIPGGAGKQLSSAYHKSICYIDDGSSTASGFLFWHNNLIMTNHHVLPSAEVAASARATFDYVTSGCKIDVALAPDQLFWCSKELDAAVCGISAADVSRLEGAGIRPFPFVDWSDSNPREGDPVLIEGHPAGRLREMSMNKIKAVPGNGSYLYTYDADTEPGSSGSPVIGATMKVILLHSQGGSNGNKGVDMKSIMRRFWWGAHEARGICRQAYNWLSFAVDNAWYHHATFGGDAFCFLGKYGAYGYSNCKNLIDTFESDIRPGVMKRDGMEVKSVALTPDGEGYAIIWGRKGQKSGYRSCNIPAGAATALKELADEGEEVHFISFHQGGGYLILYGYLGTGTRYAFVNDAHKEAMFKIRLECLDQQIPLRGMNWSADGNQWCIWYGKNGHWRSGDNPDAMKKHCTDINSRKREIRSVSFGHGKNAPGWVVLSDQYPGH